MENEKKQKRTSGKYFAICECEAGTIVITGDNFKDLNVNYRQTQNITPGLKLMMMLKGHELSFFTKNVIELT